MNTSKPVISFTDAAIVHIKESVREEGGMGFRLSVKEAGCSGFSYITDIIKSPSQTDIAFEEKGLHVFVDPNCMKYIKGTQLDFVNKGLGQKQLIFKNPNVDHLCGCGESFHIEEENGDE